MPVPLNHADAIANIGIDGLAACCFNRKDKIWTTAFPHQGNHVFQLYIDGKLVPLKRADGSYPETIKIGTNKGVTPDYQQCPGGFWFSGAGFCRDPNRDHHEDFRWVLDFESADLKHSKVTAKKPKRTRLLIENAIFYTRKLTTSSFLMAPQGPEPVARECKLVGLTNDEIGADILCEEKGELSIKIEGEAKPLILPAKDQPYAIIFKNLENEDGMPHQLSPDRLAKDEMYEKGDFCLYYELLKPSGPGLWDIWGPSGSVNKNGRIDCDSIRLSEMQSLP